MRLLYVASSHVMQSRLKSRGDEGSHGTGIGAAFAFAWHVQSAGTERGSGDFLCNSSLSRSRQRLKTLDVQCQVSDVGSR